MGADVDAQAPLRVVNSVAEHQAKRARSAQADASSAKPQGRPPNNLHPRPFPNPSQATSSTAPQSQPPSLSEPAVHATSGTGAPPQATPSATDASPPKRKGPPSILASIVVSMDDTNGVVTGEDHHHHHHHHHHQQQQQVAAPARHPVADGWSLPAGLYPSYPSTSGAGGPEDPMQARLDSHGQAGPRGASSRQSPTCMKSGGSPSQKARARGKASQHAARDGVTAKITSGRGRGHKARRCACPPGP